MTVLNGIDVSSYQPARIAAMVPADFVVVKASGGTWYRNPRAALQLEAAAEAGVTRRGLYHFAHEGAKQSARDEAAYFLQSPGAANRGTVPVLDWEDGDTSDVEWALEWLALVKDATGTTPLLYCNLSVATSYDWSAVQALGVKLWLAWYGNDAQVDGYDYPETLVFRTSTMNGWTAPAIWQYTQHGRLPGYAADLDLNVAYTDVWAPVQGKLLVPGVPLP